MLNPFRSLRRLIATSALAVVCVVGVISFASADLVQPDGDVLANGLSPLSYSDSKRPCSQITDGTAADGALNIKYSGNKHFAPDQTLAVTFTPLDKNGSAVSGISAVPGDSSVPTGYNGNGDSFAIPFATTVASSVPDGTYKVFVDVVGKDQAGKTLTAVDDAGGRPFYMVKVACSGGGGPAGDSVSVLFIDATPAPNGAGWNNSDVTVRWSIDSSAPVTTSPACGSDPDSDGTYSYTYDTETSGTQLTCTATITGSSPEVSDSDTSRTIKLDKTAPTVAVTGLAGPYTLGGTGPTPGCSTTDPGSVASGVKTQATVTSTTNPNANGVGTWTVTCSGALDNADNPGSNTGTYDVRYPQQVAGTCVILQPINCDNTSVFSRGKSVPVKFKIPGFTTTQMAALDPSGWRVSVGAVPCEVTNTQVNESVDTTQSNQGTDAPRWSTDQFVYNADLRKYDAGKCYQAVVRLDDGFTKYWSAVFRLQK